MNEGQAHAILSALYYRAGGHGAADMQEMLRRIADDGSHLLRHQAFPATFEAAALEAISRLGALENELRIDLLALACEAGHGELAAALLDTGIAWREGDAYQCMALAIHSGKPALLALLLRAGLAAILRAECGTPILRHAIASGDAAMVTLLRNAGARADSEGSALVAAAVGGQLDMLQMCVEDGAPAAALGDALDQAAAVGKPEAVMLLLRAGAPTEPALLHAAQRGDTDMVDLICTTRAAQLLAAGIGQVLQR